MPDENIDQQPNTENISNQPIVSVNNFATEFESMPMGPISPANSETTENDISPVLDMPTEPFTPSEVILPTATTSIVAQPIAVAETPKKHKNILIFIIAIFLAILVGGGSAFAYTFIYQNPQKVITDSIINAFTANDSVYVGKITSKDSESGLDVTIDITAKKADATGSLAAKVIIVANGKTYAVNGDALLDAKGDAYFRLNDLTDIAVEAKSILGVIAGSKTSNSIDTFVSEVNGVWVKISNSDIAQYSEDYSAKKTCLDKAIGDFKDDKSALSEISDLYKDNSFIVVKEELKQEGNSFGYKLKIDETKSGAFISEIANTKIYKSLNGCDDSITTDSLASKTDSVSKENSSVNLWVDMWSHKITKIEANTSDDTSKTTLLFTPNYGQKADISTPTSPMKSADFMSSAQKMIQSFNFNIGLDE